MATWIVHLRLAEKLLELINGLDPAYFSIGNIAPDSGIPDENWENFDPPPEILHFKAPDGGKWRLADLDFYRRYLYPLENPFSQVEQFSFLLGYFYHLVTDNLWDEKIGKPTRERFTTEFEADSKFVWEVKRDWYGLDFEYVRGNPESIFWQVFLDCRYDHDFLEFLPQKAVQQRLEYIQAFYQRTDEKIENWYIDRPDKYLTVQEMDSFIQTATKVLGRIYRTFWQEGIKAQQGLSSLSLIAQPLE